MLVCDDYDSYRLLLRVALGHEDDLEVVAEAANGREAIDLATKLHPDVIVLDLSMPEMDGFNAIESLLLASPTSKVVVLSSLDPSGAGDRVIDLGASAYLDKDTPVDEIAETIRLHAHA